MERLYTISEFADALNVSVQTLRNWDKSGKLKPARVSEGGHRYYTETQLFRAINNNLGEREIVGYCRRDIKDSEFYLEKQKEKVMDYMISKGYSFKIIQDVGAVDNFDKLGITTLLIKLSRKEISRIVVANYDVLGEQYYGLFHKIALLSGAEIEVIDKR